MRARSRSPKEKPASCRLDLRVESLESRTMLAGNVTAAIVNGDLQITGDALSNDITVGITLHPPISGPRLFVHAHEGTTVNGQQDVFFNLAQLEDDIRITMGPGDDTVAFTTSLFSVPDDVVIRTDSGNDTVTANGPRVNGRLRIATGDGSDRVTIQRSSLLAQLGSLDIRTASGSDVVALNELNVVGTTRISTGNDADDVIVRNDVTFRGEVVVGMGKAAEGTFDQLRLRGEIDHPIAFKSGLSITGRGGAQLAILDYVDVAGPLNVSLGGATDQFDGGDIFIGGPVNVQMGGGQDFLFIKDWNLADTMTIDSGGGDDGIDIEDVVSDSEITVRSGNGNDVLEIEEVELSGPVFVDTGSGADWLELNDSITTELHVTMGNGRDALSLVQSTLLSGPTVFDGGAGQDTILGASYQVPPLPSFDVQFVSFEDLPN